MQRIFDEIGNELLDELKGLKGMNLGTPEYEKTVSGIVALADKMLAMKKQQQDHELAEANALYMVESKKAELADRVSAREAELKLRKEELMERANTAKAELAEKRETRIENRKTKEEELAEHRRDRAQEYAFKESELEERKNNREQEYSLKSAELSERHVDREKEYSLKEKELAERVSARKSEQLFKHDELNARTEAQLADYDLRKAEFEAERTEAQQENMLKKTAAKNSLIAETSKTLVTLLGVAVPAAIGMWGVRKTFEFEEFGTITSIAGRAMLNEVIKNLKK